MTMTEHQTINQPDAPLKREYTLKERLLLLAALTIGVLFDRMIFNLLERDMPELWGVFWLCYLVMFYGFYWKRLKLDKILWLIAGFAAALCLWGIIFDFSSNWQYGMLAMLVIPGVLMAHAVMAAGEYTFKNVGGIVAAWFAGWIIKPLSALPNLIGAVGSLVSGGRRSTAKKAALGAVIALPFLLLLIAMLAGADQVFGYYVNRITQDWDLASFVGHSAIVLTIFALFYSFLWNIIFGERAKAGKPLAGEIDRVICNVVLGSVALLYLLFCGIQFTYLFAGAGLPGGLTYSEYAREGFAQTVAVCTINLCIFGMFLRFGAKKKEERHRPAGSGNSLPVPSVGRDMALDKTVKILLAGLLGLTGVMLFSGAVRLKLYIDAFGLTWLRLLSAWFIIWLAAVIVICAVRMVKKGLPAVFLCAVSLLIWFTVLGYANPNALAERYNRSHGYDSVPIAETPCDQAGGPLL
jgi:hypothetical protein